MSGKYTINGLPSGEYTVLFSGADYLAQYYNGKATASEATPVSVKLGATAPGVDAALEPGGKITGTVTDAASKAAIAEASVCASSSAALRCATTNASGEYTITGLPTGEYTVKFSASTYASQYYDGAETAAEATPVPVTAGVTSAGINVALRVGAQISGKVTDSATSAAVAGALVCASGDVGVGCDTTNTGGEYTITGLATGEYTVKFSASTYIPQYWNGKANASEATPLSITVGTTTPGVNAALHVGGQITGKVTDESTKGAIDGVLACASNGAGGGNCGVTNEAGEYTISGLASGEYTVKFTAATYVSQFYNGKASASEATPVSVTAPATTGAVNATLHVGGQIAGKVTAAAAKEPVAGALVCASGTAGEVCGLSNEAGEYTISGLETGEYTVKFSTLTYAPQYYNGKANVSEATPVSVKAGATTSAINATLQAGGQITGTVTDGFTKKALAGALVCVSPSVGLGCATTNAGGEYMITGLGTGEYTVKFSAATYASQYYNGKAAAAEATPVKVKAGATQSGINATLQPSGEITGKVTDSSTTKAIAGAKVCAAGAAGEACTTTGESGEYAITGLDTGEYTVKFLASTYVPQYYSGKARASEATPVAIKAGGTTSGINASLLLGGRITGAVTDASTKKAIAGATVCASPSGGLGCATTNSSGEYAITGLATGSEYTVKFSAATYASQYYNEKANSSEATHVSVKAGATTTEINAALKPSGQITGKVTDAASKKALAEATVCATGTAGESCGLSNEHGEYTLTGLGGGEYKVMFSAPGYVSQYYNGKANASEATPVSVKAGATTKEINAQLQPEPKFEVEVLQRFSGEASYTEERLTGKAPAKLEYEVTVTNTGSVPVKVESILDAQISGCQTPSPKQGEVKVGETSVVEAVCSRTVGKEGGTVKNAATVKAGGKEETTGEVEALVEGEAHFETEIRERGAGEPAYTKGPLLGQAPLTVEYEVLVTNNGSVPEKVENIRDAQISGCQSTSPKHPEVKVGETGVMEVVCSHTITFEGETFKNAAVVKAGGKEAPTGQVEATTEVAPEATPTPEPEPPSSPPAGGDASQNGPPSNGGNVLGSQSTTLSHAQIEAALGRLLTPAAKARVIATLLKSAGLVLQASGLEAGTLQITWYELPAGAKLAAKKATPKPVVVATGRVTVPGGGGVKIKVKLSSAGISLLKHAKRQKLTARAIFTPSGGAPVSDTGSFEVKR